MCYNVIKNVLLKNASYLHNDRVLHRLHHLPGAGAIGIPSDHKDPLTALLECESKSYSSVPRQQLAFLQEFDQVVSKAYPTGDLSGR